jgi:hypothetical protein
VRDKSISGTSSALLSKNILGEVSDLCGYRLHFVGPFPHFVFASTVSLALSKWSFAPCSCPIARLTAFKADNEAYAAIGHRILRKLSGE